MNENLKITENFLKKSNSPSKIFMFGVRFGKVFEYLNIDIIMEGRPTKAK